MMFQYSKEHGGLYPTGKSSTEVFQKLIDGGYASDPSIFWDPVLDSPGKSKPTSNILKPENVSWDVTVPVDSHSPDSLPVVFSTGYRVMYVSDGSAIPRTAGNVGIEICYKNMSNIFVQDDRRPDGIVHDAVPNDFKSDGKTYQQLTPDGLLSP